MKIKLSGKLNRKATAVAVICLCLAAAGIVLLIHRYLPGNKWADYDSLYGPQDGKAAVYIKNEEQEFTAKIKNDEAYLMLEDVNSYLTDGFYFSDEKKLLYTLPDMVVYASEGDKGFLKGSETVNTEHEICFIEEGNVWISMEFICLFADWKEELFLSPERLYIDSGTAEYRQAVAGRDTVVRYRAGIKSPILCRVKKGDVVEIVGELDNWYCVRTSDGFTGYLKKKTVEREETVMRNSGFTEPNYTGVKEEGNVLLAWHQVFDQNGNDALEEYLMDTEGITVLSPTWFALCDNEGNFTSIADASYVEKAHAKGIKVWALIDDFDPELDLYELFSSSSARKNLTEGLVSAAQEYALDGINIDFESIDNGTGPHFVQFIRELSVACRNNKLTLSVDNYVVSGGRSWYNLSQQGKYADYVIVMGYDEHWKGCHPGTNASIGFTESAIKDITAVVAGDKVIHGIPFFMRVWTETPEELAGPEAEIIEDGNSRFGRYAVTSRAVGMAEGKKLLEDNNADIVWDETLGQYYGEYEQDGSLYRIWLEDTRSLELKVRLIEQYKLAGTACWKLGLETPEAWDVLAADTRSELR